MHLKHQLTALVSGSPGARDSPDLNANEVASPALSGEREHRKTTGSSSGVSSDLSDSENEHLDGHHHHHHEAKQDGKEQVQHNGGGPIDESGVFESSTLCGRSASSNSSGSTGHLADTGTQTPEPDSDVLDGERLARHRAKIESHKSPTILRHASDYESCEELDDLREECRGLVVRKNSLEHEIESYKGEIKTLRSQLEETSSVDSPTGGGGGDKVAELEMVEFGLRNQLKEWERKYHELQRQNQALLEEKCELEEEENDSRLRAQRLDQQYRLSVENCELLTADLDMERKGRLALQEEVGELRGREARSKEESAYLEALVQRYEQRIFELEEVEVELREKLTLLEQACNAVAWINKVLPHQADNRQVDQASKMGEDVDLRKLPLVIAFEEQGTQTAASPVPKEAPSDFEEVVQRLQQEKDSLQGRVDSLRDEKEVLSKNLEDVSADQVKQIAVFEGKVTELSRQAEDSGKRSMQEIKDLKDKLEKQESLYQKRIQELESLVREGGPVKVDDLKTELSELQAKEAAYSQTIQEADTIMAKVECNYKDTISALQAETKSLRERLEMLSSQENIVKESILTLGNDGAAHQKLADVLEKLIEAEQQVLALKDRVHALEKNERELSLRLMKEKEDSLAAKTQLHEQELLLASAGRTKKEREEALEEVARLRGLEKKLLDAQQSEGFLRGRVEELELAEAGLREDMAKVDREAAERERQLQSRLGRAEDDLREREEASSRSQREETAKRNALKIEVEGLASKLGEAERTAEAKRAEAEATEASFRSEVSIPQSCSRGEGDKGEEDQDGGTSLSRVTSRSSSSFSLSRYRSIRDHTGRYFLVVKIS